MQVQNNLSLKAIEDNNPLLLAGLSSSAAEVTRLINFLKEDLINDIRDSISVIHELEEDDK